MDWKKLLSPKRLGKSEVEDSPTRAPFQGVILTELFSRQLLEGFKIKLKFIHCKEIWGHNTHFILAERSF